MIYLVLVNVIMSAAVAGAAVAAGAWATFAAPSIGCLPATPAARDIQSYRQVIVERRLAHGVA